ncbi:hypothetical protein LNP25_01280 [Klebsiella variicola subsp. variicola]|nr:hypothetical protein [Klebsiella variicola subsp. variicola]
MRRPAAVSDVTALLPHHQAARDAQYASCWFPDPQLLSRSPGLKLIRAASAGSIICRPRCSPAISRCAG